MIQTLKLENFKNFKKAQLKLANFTLLIGENATGKSNIKDALRFLNGISHHYRIADILGDKYSLSGGLEWRGIRGGTNITFSGTESFALEIAFDLKHIEQTGIYRIEIIPKPLEQIPKIKTESFRILGKTESLFEAKLQEETQKINLVNITSNLTPYKTVLSHIDSLNSDKSLLTQSIIELNTHLNKMRFFDFNPDIMRQPSVPGQIILGERGENLSSVLQNICQDPSKKETLLEWITELTPMDAIDLKFPSDFTGKILLILVEKNGSQISAINASDGTLKFLGLIAALMDSDNSQIYFFEELDNGIHPTRLNLVLQLIENQVKHNPIQIIATTHSPQLLRLLNPESLKSVFITYRLHHQPEAKIESLLNIPNLPNLIHQQDLARLFESGWLEDTIDLYQLDEVIA